ncbi:hypothetical protein SAMN05421840_10185 [Shewanella morhuae]|nr:hypothetical protein SAMN05421840_10185 [Shewanella morhuae]
MYFIVIANLCITILLVVQFKNFAKIQRHVEKYYPEEWHKASANPMKARLSTARSAYIRESLQYGFLSTQEDLRLTQFTRNEKRISYLCSVILLCGFIFALVY